MKIALSWSYSHTTTTLQSSRETRAVLLVGIAVVLSAKGFLADGTVVSYSLCLVCLPMASQVRRGWEGKATYLARVGLSSVQLLVSQHASHGLKLSAAIRTANRSLLSTSGQLASMHKCGSPGLPETPSKRKKTFSTSTKNLRYIRAGFH